MKLINHHKGNFTFDDSHNGSVMYGTIYVTESEFADIVKRIKRSYRDAVRSCSTHRRDALSHVISWTLRNHGNDKRLCLGVTATALIAKWYKLPRYKHQNYVIERA
ncbi:MAG: hypothetical protein KBD16_00685 [Candidatus Pacebacteria bacterium]|nr:hypothetical protein [Candidatus Paceibacterota bacterium]